MLKGALASQPKVLFCPGSDQPVDEEAELAQVGVGQAQCSYYYRHAGNTNPFDTPGGPFVPNNIKLDNLGKNANGQPIRALAIDTQFLCPAGWPVSASRRARITSRSWRAFYSLTGTPFHGPTRTASSPWV